MAELNYSTIYIGGIEQGRSTTKERIYQHDLFRENGNTLEDENSNNTGKNI
jgi:hypothetical protein